MSPKSVLCIHRVHMRDAFPAVTFLITCSDSLWERKGSRWAAIRGSSSDSPLTPD